MRKGVKQINIFNCYFAKNQHFLQKVLLRQYFENSSKKFLEMSWKLIQCLNRVLKHFFKEKQKIVKIGHFQYFPNPLSKKLFSKKNFPKVLYKSTHTPPNFRTIFRTNF